MGKTMSQQEQEKDQDLSQGEGSNNKVLSQREDDNE